MSMLYVVFVLGITLWLGLVFNALVGLRVVTFKGALHARVHRWVSFALIVGGLALGVLAIGTLVLGWFY
jgi:hypothetical protein